MSQLPRYDSYKDSGVQWLGEIPSHWKCLSIKRLTLVKRGASPRPIDDPKYFDDEGEYAWVRIADVTASDKNLLETTQRLSELGSSLSVKMQPDSIFLSIAGSVGKPIITKIKACIHDGFVYFPDWKESINFLYYIFASGQPYLGLGKLGTQLNLNTDTVGNIKIALPPSDEQEAIVDFLDKRLAQVDALIAKQETLLGKLAEQRVALISHAVTKGLNPDVDFFVSKNAWLGEIPKGWILKPTKYFLSYVGSGKTPKGGAEVYIDEGVIMIRSQNVHDEGLRLEDVVHITDEADQGQINTRVYEDDVLLNITGASLGRVSLVPKGIPLANVNQHVCILRPIQSLILPQFLHLIMQSHYAKSLIKSEENGTSREGLTFEQIKAMVFALPPIDEQQAICEKIQSDLDDLNKSKNSCKNLIKKLKEYRSTLITQVVTGKIDVRKL